MNVQEKLSALEVVSTLWPIFASLVFGAGVALIWFIRLEQKAKYTAIDLKEHKEEVKEAHKQIKADSEKNNLSIWNAITGINNNFNKLFESLGELKGLINHNKKD